MHKDVTLKERLVYRRNTLNLTQADLAARAGLSERSVSDYERGLSQPSLEQLRKLARALDVRSSYLLGEESIIEAMALNDRARAPDLAGYSNVETAALENILTELSGKLRGLSLSSRKHVLANLRSILDVLEEREHLGPDEVASEAGRRAVETVKQPGVVYGRRKQPVKSLNAVAAKAVQQAVDLVKKSSS